METPPTVFVVDDEVAIRCWLESLLTHNGFRVKCYASAEEFTAAYHPDEAACLILDVRMPGSDGFELQQQLITRKISIPIVFLTASMDIKGAVNAMRDGAFHFLQKPVNPRKLVAIVREAVELEKEQRRRREFCAKVQKRLARLARCERDVLERLIEGKSSKTIAQERGKSDDTIRKQRTSILRKMEVDSVSELVRLVTSAEIQLEADSPRGPHWNQRPSYAHSSESQFGDPQFDSRMLADGFGHGDMLGTPRRAFPAESDLDSP